MSKKMLFSIGMLVVIVIGINFSLAQSGLALNREPGIEVENEYIWKAELYLDGYIFSSEYYRDRISAIIDYGNETWINGTREELWGNDWLSVREGNITEVFDCAEDDLYDLFIDSSDWPYLIRDTKIGDYKDEIVDRYIAEELDGEDPVELTKSKTIQRGYGIEFHVTLIQEVFFTELLEIILVYNEEGVFERQEITFEYEGEDPPSFWTTQSYVFSLEYVNGEKYKAFRIPGYSTLLLFAITIVGIYGIQRKLRKRDLIT